MFKDLKYLFGLSKFLFNYYVRDTAFVKSYDLTYRCNLSCKHCYFYKNYSKSTDDSLTDNQWKEFFIREKMNGVRELHLTGGEPMLRMRVIEFANEIFGERHVNIYTNGTIPLPPLWRNSFFVSIDGDVETQKKVRGLIIWNKYLQILGMTKGL